MDAFHARDFDHALEASIKTDVILLESFLKQLTEFQKTTKSKDITLNQVKDVIDHWSVADLKKTRLLKLINNFLEQNPSDPVDTTTQSLRQILLLIVQEHQNVKKQAQKEKHEPTPDQEERRLIEHAYLGYLQSIDAYDPTTGQVNRTIPQLDAIHKFLVSRDGISKARTARLFAREKKYPKPTHDSYGTDSLASVEMPLADKKPSVDLLETLKKRTNKKLFGKQATLMKSLIKKVDFYPQPEMIIVLPREDFYRLPFEKQQEFIKAFEACPEFVVMEDLSRIDFPSNEDDEKNYFDEYAQDSTFKRYQEHHLLAILNDVDEKTGIAQRAKDYQAKLLETERWNEEDLVDPVIFKILLEETKKDLHGVFEGQVIELKFQRIRLEQMAHRLREMDRYRQVILETFEDLLTNNPGLADTPFILSDHHATTETWNTNQKVETADWSKIVSKDYKEPHTLKSLLEYLTLQIWQKVFHSANEVPYEVLRERIRCELVSHYRTRLENEASELGDQELQHQMIKFSQLVTDLFTHPFNTGSLQDSTDDSLSYKKNRSEFFYDYLEEKKKKKFPSFKKIPHRNVRFSTQIRALVHKSTQLIDYLQNHGFEEMQITSVAKKLLMLIQLPPYTTVNSIEIPSENLRIDMEYTVVDES